MFLAAAQNGYTNGLLLSVTYLLILAGFVAAVVFIIKGIKRFFTKTLKGIVKEAVKEANEEMKQKK